MDEAGNTTSRGDGIDLAYDQRNRLAEVTLPGGNTRYTYLYNGKGERVGKKKALAGNTVGATYYVYDEGGRLLGEYTASGAPVAEYLCFNDALYAVATPSDLDYVETDHLGTPRKLWSTSRQTYVWSWDVLDAKGLFGATSPDADPDLDGAPRVFNLRFPGQYFDSETGLNYNYFRDYEPGTGRYVESDPMGVRGGIDTYAYVRSNPLYSGDSFGLDSNMDQLTQLEKARDKAIKIMRNCANCTDCGQDNYLKGYCLSEAEKNRVVIMLGASQYELAPPGGSGDCARRKGGNTVYIFPDALAGKCCSLPTILAHEAGHLANLDPINITKEHQKIFWYELKCFGCDVHYGGHQSGD